MARDQSSNGPDCLHLRPIFDQSQVNSTKCRPTDTSTTVHQKQWLDQRCLNRPEADMQVIDSYVFVSTSLRVGELSPLADAS
jgi:hypothetical protein